jgi:hypothetical protein
MLHYLLDKKITIIFIKHTLFTITTTTTTTITVAITVSTTDAATTTNTTASSIKLSPKCAL